MGKGLAADLRQEGRLAVDGGRLQGQQESGRKIGAGLSACTRFPPEIVPTAGKRVLRSAISRRLRTTFAQRNRLAKVT